MKKIFSLISLVVIASIILAACQEQPPTPGNLDPNPTQNRAEPVATQAHIYKVLRMNLGLGDVPTLDPAIAEDSNSIQVIRMTFTGLTNINEITSATEPGTAASWESVNNADGTQTVTFHLQQNIPWVRWNGTSVETVKACDGTSDRMLTAGDFAYGIQRNLDPQNASPYGYLLSFVLKGANDFNSGTTTDISTVGVHVVDDTTLEMTFLTQAVYNLQIAGLWVARPQPKWLIEGDDCTQAVGERWIETGYFESYGPYTLKEWVHDSTLTLIKNPFWPGNEAVPQPKIDEIEFTMLDEPAALVEYEAGNLDIVRAPLSDLDRIKTDPVLSKELNISPVVCTYYYGFNTQAPVVNDIRVRRALSMAIDRQSLIDNVTKGNQEPAQWFDRPGIAGSPTMADHPDLGVKYDPVSAKALLQEYLDETNLKAEDLDLTLMFNTSAAHQRIAETIQQMWQDVLGVKVKLVNQEFDTFLVTTKSRNTPQIYRQGWCMDYPDANNFDREVFSVNGSMNPADENGPYGGINWKNDAYERLVVQAAVEPDPVKRVDLYAQAEQILVWEDATIIPIYWYTALFLTKPNVTRTFGVGNDQAIDKWDIVP